MKEKVIYFLRPCIWFAFYMIVEALALQVNIIFGLIAAGFTLWYVIKHPIVKPRKLKYNGIVIDIALLVGILIVSALYKLLVHFGTQGTSVNQTDIINMAKTSPAIYVFIIIIAPVFEETIFRYSIINFKSKKWLIGSTIVSLICFVGCHLSNSMSDWQYFFQYLIPASGLTASYIITKDIRYSIGLHAAYNTLSALALIALLH